MKIINIEKVEGEKFVSSFFISNRFQIKKFFTVIVTFRRFFFFKIKRKYFPLNKEIIYKSDFIISYCDISGKECKKEISASITNYFNFK